MVLRMFGRTYVRESQAAAFARFAAKRCALAVPVLIGVATVVFATVALIPGDPVTSMLGPGATPDAVAELTGRLGLDRPLPVRWWEWISATARGDLGTSIAQQRPVGEIVMTAFGNTLVLAAAAGLLVLIGGVALGTLTAVGRGRVAGRASSALSILAISAPQYSVALLLVVLLGVQSALFPTGGMYDAIGGGSLGDRLHHLALPALAAALVPLGVTARVYAASLTDVLNADFVESMRARGLSEAAVVRHAVRNALPSLLTIGGLQIAYLLEGVVFVETIFAWPGIGQTLFQAIQARDLPVIEAGVLVTAVAFVGLTIAVDALHWLLDPRTRR